MNLSRVIGCLTLCALLAAGCGRREPDWPESESPLSVRVSTNEVELGQTFHVSARLVANAADRIEWPVAGAPPALVQRLAREASYSKGEKTFRTWHSEVLALRPGQFTVWTGAVIRTAAGGEQTRIEIPPQVIRVVTTLDPRDQTLRDIVGIQRWPEPRWIQLLVGLAAISLLALLAALIARWRSRRSKRLEPTPSLSPHEKALRALAAMRARGWPGPAGVEAFYVELSAIVRTYLEEAFRLRAPEQTTEEFIRTASSSSALNAEQRQRVIAFLEQSDLVKFARHQPLHEDMENAMSAAQQLVEETTPPPPP